MTDDELLSRFEAVRLRASGFDHGTHVRVAFLCLSAYGLDDGMERYRTGLRSFAERAGVPQKYHETVTCALLLIIHDRMRAAEARDGWPAFARANPDLLVWLDGPLFRHYDRDVLQSAEARRRFVLPAGDAPPLPVHDPETRAVVERLLVPLAATR